MSCVLISYFLSKRTPALVAVLTSLSFLSFSTLFPSHPLFSSPPPFLTHPRQNADRCQALLCAAGQELAAIGPAEQEADERARESASAAASVAVLIQKCNAMEEQRKKREKTLKPVDSAVKGVQEVLVSAKEKADEANELYRSCMAEKAEQLDIKAKETADNAKEAMEAIAENMHVMKA